VSGAVIKLTLAEVQSGHDRQKWAEGLILQLPRDHDGRNSWLLNFGTGPEAAMLRSCRPSGSGIPFNEETRAAQTTR